MPTPWVTFDLDGTLLQNPYWRLTLFPWIQQQSANRRHSDWKQFWDPIVQEGQQRWKAGRWVEAYDWSDIIRQVWNQEAPRPEKVAWQQVAPLCLPGVLWLLPILKTYPVRLGIITNGLAENQLPFIQSLGWDRIFEVIVTTTEKTRCKPDPRVFTPFDGPILCHIGDRVNHDVLVAQRAHTTSVLYQPHWNPEDRHDPLSPARVIPHYILPDYWELPALIRHLLRNVSL